NVLHVHAMCPYQLLDLRLPRAPHQVAQERLMGINRVNQSAELLGKRQRLTARTAAGIDDNTKLPFRKQAQDMQGVGVAARAELFHAVEEQADWIGSVHAIPVRLRSGRLLPTVDVREPAQEETKE